MRLLEERPGLQRVEVDLGDGPERAYVLTQLTGPVDAGDRVVVNTTAVELGLGTGGWHVVHWNLARDEWTRARARATSSRAATRASRPTSGAPRSTWPELAEVESIDGMPVVAAALHSQLPAVAVAFKRRASRRAARLRDDRRRRAAARAVRSRRRAARPRPRSTRRSRAATRSAATTRRCRSTRALAVARHVARADAAVVVMGPGIVGTDTRLGFSGIEVGPILDAAVGARRASPIACLRVSFADQRERHRGVSHHSVDRAAVATRSRVARRRCRRVGGDEEATLRADLARAGHRPTRHDVVDVAPAGIVELLATHGLDVVVDGAARRPTIPVLFEAAAAAGVVRGRARRAPVACRDARRARPRRTRPEPARAAARHARAADARRASCSEVSGYPPQAARRTAARSSATRRCCAAWASRSRPR